MGLRMKIGARLFLRLGLLACGACGGSAGEPVRSVAGPPLLADTTPADAGTPLAPPPSAAPAPPKEEPASVPAPMPATTKLARGTGGAADAALQAGDAAYDGDDFALAEAKYREAAALVP